MDYIKDFLKQFKWMFLVLVITFVIWIFVVVIPKDDNSQEIYTRTNDQCDTTERVFDYADKLTAVEEDLLRGLIAQREDQIGCDIVLVTIDEQLDKSLMAYADDFYDNHMYGYDEPWGDGVVYVDNWYDGNVWFSTCGKAEHNYSTSMINDLIDDVTSITNEDPYQAYTRYVNDVYYQMSGRSINSFNMPISAVLVLAIVITIVYTATGVANTKAKRTTTNTTYVPAGRPDMGLCNDYFISKHTTHRRIESSSGGGGGGHHRSSGGHSHGGGGGRH